jgi:hypothetical protein
MPPVVIRNGQGPGEPFRSSAETRQSGTNASGRPHSELFTNPRDKVQAMFSFKKRKKLLEVNQFIRRVIDTTSPNIPYIGGELRNEGRANRTIPILITPHDEDELRIGETCFAVTKDLSSQGVAVVIQQPFPAKQVMLGFWDEAQCVFAKGIVCYRAPLEGGFWQLGVQISEIVCTADSKELAQLAELAERLRPATEADAPVPAAVEV